MQPFIDYCWEHRIRPFLLPAHNTHVLRPLDVGVFQSLKYNFKKVVRKEIFNGATEISKVDFFSFFQRFHDCRYASESTGTNITCSGTYAVLVLDGCLFLYSLLQC
jgi:hypothetical protein